MLNNILSLPIPVLISAAIIILVSPILLRYILRNYEITEITPSPPWFKLVKKRNIISETIHHNLPQPEYGHFIGREKELAQIHRILRPYPYSQYAVVTVDGSGGVGKSALALEVAHQILRNFSSSPKNEQFTAVIWTSAKSTVLTANGIIPRKQALRTLKDICASIAVTLGQVDITHLPIGKQSEAIRKILTRQRTLLIIDNLETVDDEAVMNFILELPAPTKAIVTTRHRIDVAYPIRLTGMELEDARTLISEECRKKSVTLNDMQKQKLYHQTGGVPLAIVWSIAQLGFGYPIESIFSQLKSTTSDMALFCFETVMEKIKSKPSYRVIMALSLFPDGTTRERLGYLAGISDTARDDSLVELEKLSMINRDGANFTMLPLTRDYVLAKLENEKEIKSHLEFRLTSVPFAEILPHPSKWWHSLSTSELRVTIGKQNDGTKIEFAVGTNTGSVHTLILGMTGAGKTNFITGLILNLAINYSHDELKIWLLDYKGGQLEYQLFEKIPHIEKIADVRSADSDFRKIFNELSAEIDRRISILREYLRKDIDDLRRLQGISLPRLLLIIEEVQLIKQDTHAYEVLNELIRVGRSLGIHTIFASQSAKVSDIGSPILYGASNLFVFHSIEDDAKVLLKENSELATNLRVGEVVFQSAYLSNPVRFQSAYLSSTDIDYYIQQITQLKKMYFN